MNIIRKILHVLGLHRDDIYYFPYPCEKCMAKSTKKHRRNKK